jgi:hypothetical protein
VLFAMRSGSPMYVFSSCARGVGLQRFVAQLVVVIWR